MSIDIEVGIFVDRAKDEEDSSGFYAYYDRAFEAINTFLLSNGLPEHHEPLTLAAGQSSFHRTGTSELFPFKDIAWDIERQTSWHFPQLDLIGEDAIYLPLLFEGVLGPVPGGRMGNARCFGSSYKLYEECRLLAKALGIYGEIEDDTNVFGIARFSRDPVVLLLERALDLDNTENNAPLSLMRDLALQCYPALAENPWAVLGTGACMNLYEATKFSVKHKATLVIH